MDVWMFIGAVNGFLAVAAGAFAAHGLQGRVNAGSLAVFQTGALYHLVHALAIALAALAAGRAMAAGPARAAAALFLAGIVLFSGSLYLLGATGSQALVLLTPVGGVSFLAGWAMLAYGAARKRN